MSSDVIELCDAQGRRTGGRVGAANPLPTATPPKALTPTVPLAGGLTYRIADVGGYSEALVRLTATGTVTIAFTGTQDATGITNQAGSLIAEVFNYQANTSAVGATLASPVTLADNTITLRVKTRGVAGLLLVLGGGGSITGLVVTLLPFADGEQRVFATMQQGTSSTANISAATAVKGSAGRVVRVSCTTAGSTAGSVNDAASTGAAAASNLVATIPAAVGVTHLDWPMSTGIVITPGTGQVLAVSYS